jgi:hypothetical protein
MPYAPRSGPLTRGGLVLLDLEAGKVVGVAVFQYNPETLVRTLSATDDHGVTDLVQVEAVYDATDRLSAGDEQARLGVAPQLAALELVASPPPEVRRPQAVLVWGPSRVSPVRVTELVTTEEAFDRELHPIRARVAITMETLREPGPDAPPIARRLDEERRRLAELGQGSLKDLGLDEKRLF